MAEAHQAESGKLKPDVLRQLKEGTYEVKENTNTVRKRYPSRRQLRRWMQAHPPPKPERPWRVSDVRLGEMEDGKVIPWHAIRILAGYLGVEADAIANRVHEPPAKIDVGPNPWALGWHGVFQHFTRFVEFPPGSLCENEADVGAAASMIVECVGRHAGPEEDSSLTTAQALFLGEQIMKRTRDDYAKWLLATWRICPDAIMFACTQDNGGAPQRVGVVVSLPLTREAYVQTRSGLLEDIDLTPSHLQRPTEYLHINAIVQLRAGALRRRREVGGAQIFTLLRQFVTLASTGENAWLRPSLISFAGTPENERRALAYSFRHVGTLTPRTGKKVMEFALPSLSTATLRDYASYQVMCALINLFHTLMLARQRVLAVES